MTLCLLVPSFSHGLSSVTSFCLQCSLVSALTFNMVKCNNSFYRLWLFCNFSNSSQR